MEASLAEARTSDQALHCQILGGGVAKTASDEQKKVGSLNPLRMDGCLDVTGWSFEGTSIQFTEVWGRGLGEHIGDCAVFLGDLRKTPAKSGVEPLNDVFGHGC